MARPIDLTRTLTPETPLYPVYDPVQVADKFTVAGEGFYVRSWTFDEHSGTHVDAPAHFSGEATVDAIAVDDLVIEAVVSKASGISSQASGTARALGLMPDA